MPCLIIPSTRVPQLVIGMHVWKIFHPENDLKLRWNQNENLSCAKWPQFAFSLIDCCYFFLNNSSALFFWGVTGVFWSQILELERQGHKCLLDNAPRLTIRKVTWILTSQPTMYPQILKRQFCLMFGCAPRPWCMINMMIAVMINPIELCTR